MRTHSFGAAGWGPSIDAAHHGIGERRRGRGDAGCQCCRQASITRRRVGPRSCPGGWPRAGGRGRRCPAADRAGTRDGANHVRDSMSGRSSPWTMLTLAVRIHFLPRRSDAVVAGLQSTVTTLQSTFNHITNVPPRNSPQASHASLPAHAARLVLLVWAIATDTGGQPGPEHCRHQDHERRYGATPATVRPPRYSKRYAGVTVAHRWRANISSAALISISSHTCRHGRARMDGGRHRSRYHRAQPVTAADGGDPPRASIGRRRSRHVRAAQRVAAARGPCGPSEPDRDCSPRPTQVWPST